MYYFKGQSGLFVADLKSSVRDTVDLEFDRICLNGFTYISNE